MHIKSRNAATMFRELVEGIHSGRITTELRASRYGECLTIPEPVILTYEKPTERVILNEYRDLNPFTNLYESLWMLAGRNNVEPLAYYTKRFREFSDDGVRFNGAYGYRWRHGNVGPEPYTNGTYKGVDQIQVIISHLRKKPESRRAVLQMWETENDLLKIDDTPCDECRITHTPSPICPGHGGVKASKDVCCNLSILFDVGLGNCKTCNARWTRELADKLDENYTKLCPDCRGKPHDRPRLLNMTVFNRSNDIVWGCLGANVVHFSILQEYMAAHLDLEVGRYNQVSNNLHCYTATWKPEVWLGEYVRHWSERSDKFYEHPALTLPSLTTFAGTALFDRELESFVEHHKNSDAIKDHRNWYTPFFQEVAQPFFYAFHNYKLGHFEGAQSWIKNCKADDWRRAGSEWLYRRITRQTTKKKV